MAKHLRALAAGAGYVVTRDELLRIAIGYERLADRVELTRMAGFTETVAALILGKEAPLGAHPA